MPLHDEHTGRSSSRSGRAALASDANAWAATATETPIAWAIRRRVAAQRLSGMAPLDLARGMYPRRGAIGRHPPVSRALRFVHHTRPAWLEWTSDKQRGKRGPRQAQGLRIIPISARDPKKSPIRQQPEARRPVSRVPNSQRCARARPAPRNDRARPGYRSTRALGARPRKFGLWPKNRPSAPTRGAGQTPALAPPQFHRVWGHQRGGALRRPGLHLLGSALLTLSSGL